jgi:hypothetical protein
MYAFIKEVDEEREHFETEWKPLLTRMKFEREFTAAWHTTAVKTLAVIVSLASLGGFILGVVRAI